VFGCKPFLSLAIGQLYSMWPSLKKWKNSCRVSMIILFVSQHCQCVAAHVAFSVFGPLSSNQISGNDVVMHESQRIVYNSSKVMARIQPSFCHLGCALVRVGWRMIC